MKYRPIVIRIIELIQINANTSLEYGKSPLSKKTRPIANSIPIVTHLIITNNSSRTKTFRLILYILREWNTNSQIGMIIKANSM
ncbi:MAG: hypothetical protein IPG02_07605 [Ignavibacteria bacterium]|nr:hypothetical protein [Ignavibacteria bacterium]